MGPLLELKKVNKVFQSRGILPSGKKGHHAVRDVSFSVDRNTIFGLVGESGCGKTTLARSIMLLDPPTGGEILYKGTDLTGLSSKELRPYRMKMQIVFQDPHSALNPKMSIFKSMKEGLANRKYPKDKIKDRIAELLELVGITPAHMNRFPHEFSGGQKQRIVIARALSMEPEILILDEPVSSLDVSIQAQIINLLMDLKEKFELTYLFISHDLNLVSYLSDRIGVMLAGRIVELAETDRIVNNPLHPYTHKLFSSSPGRMEIGDSSGDEKDRQELFEKALPEGYSFEGEEFTLLPVENGHMVGCYKNKRI